MSRHRSASHRASSRRLLGIGLGAWIGLAGPASVAEARQDRGMPPEGPATPGLDARSLMQGAGPSQEEIARIDAELLENILRIEDPVDRSLALVQAGLYKIQARDMPTARRALDQAAGSALQIADPVRRDLRLISTSRAFVELAQEDITMATSVAASVLSLEPDMTLAERVQSLEQALSAFERAGELAAQVGQIGYRPQTMYFVAEQQALGGQTIGIVAFRNPSSLGEQEAEVAPELRRLSSLYVERAAEHARSIDQPVWRDVALSAVATAAAVSNQFELGRRIAASVPGLELRFDATLAVAEGEARRGDPARATEGYLDCARILASIPIADLRGTLNDVLIESLIAAGRFPDARRCIVLYPDDVDRMEALGAVAEAMGARGLSDEARDWILREVEAPARSGLYRRVNDGVLSTLERYGRGDIYGTTTEF